MDIYYMSDSIQYSSFRGPVYRDYEKFPYGTLENPLNNPVSKTKQQQQQRRHHSNTSSSSSAQATSANLPRLVNRPRMLVHFARSKRSDRSVRTCESVASASLPKASARTRKSASMSCGRRTRRRTCVHRHEAQRCPPARPVTTISTLPLRVSDLIDRNRSKANEPGESNGTIVWRGCEKRNHLFNEWRLLIIRYYGRC
uniref:Uncharacterized protein n=1 Tax=Anopheles funestus TaxID=62324 RepID=A0A4Y0BL48_ANOFN